MPDFRSVLASGQAILFDGAMGTEIYRRGVFVNVCFDDLCRSSPELIREIHEAYRSAGAQVLETNSFGANRLKLRAHGLDSQVRELNEAAARLARDVAGDELFVAGSIGPLGVRLEPFGPTSKQEARQMFAEQAGGLVAGGADLLSVETFSDLAELIEAVEGCRSVCDLPVLAMMTVSEGGLSSYGESAVNMAKIMSAMGVEAIGVNCSVGPAVMVDVVQEMAAVTDLPLAAIANAGFPRDVDDRKMYMASPDYMASYARKLIKAGARIVGGCCGTSPQHTAEMASQIRAVALRATTVTESSSAKPAVDTQPAATEPAESQPAATEPVPLADRSAWGQRLAAGLPVTSVEIVPPRGADPSQMVEACKQLAAAGVHAVNVPDGARAMMRMGVIAASCLIEREAGIEAVVHYCCRDRNLLGMMSDLLGAQALGLRNLLLITGDPPRMGPYPDATAVFDIDSIGLTNLVSGLNRGLDPGGHEIGGQTSFVIGVGVNPCEADMNRELERWYWKVEAGAEYAVTQPVFDVDSLLAFLDKIDEGTRIPIVAGIWPLTSLRNAEFLANEVPGIEIPEPIMARMQAAQERGAEFAREEGCAIAREMVAAVSDRVQGVQVSAPFGRVKYALDVLAGLDA
ncbi:MAG: bifunctional homocysteine S-methyltransferase/methylenetetrahydrofolate reductase [Gemmatimonadota bacterium]